MSESTAGPIMAGSAPTFPPDEPAKPVAIVWCRQVDNEAESPGYTTVPEEFPGRSETLETVRTIGHLTVNVADTHDYWDPDPFQPLAYYPNLFLYPTWDGQYTCIGRMFLSKEDRPRLGMKTLVLRTSELLEHDGFGAAVLRWFSTMGGPRRDAGRPGAAPEAALYDLVAEGFLYHHGTTDPVVLIGAGRWEPAMHVVLEMIRGLPSSLVALTTVLAFPYFLPSVRTEVREFPAKLPFSLALMRVPPSESEGDRHERRVQGWEASATTVRDLTGPTLAGSSGKGTEPLPLVVRYIRDRDEERLSTLRSRVDAVEVPALRARLTEPALRDGKKRRKEAWRIATAMENAAMLLSRPRGRQLSMTSETAKRAREYLDAGRHAAAPPTAAGATAPAARGVAPAAAPEPVASTPRPAEAVPVPRRSDPVRLPPDPTTLPPFGGAVPGELSLLDEQAIRRIVLTELDRRGSSGTVIQQRLGEEIARSISLGIASSREKLTQEFLPRLVRIEERLDRMGRPGAGSSEPAGPSAPAEPPDFAPVIAEVTDQVQRATQELRTAFDEELERRFQGVAQSQNDARGALDARLAAARESARQELDDRLKRWQEERLPELANLVRDEVARQAMIPPPAPAAGAVDSEAIADLESRLHEEIGRQVQDALSVERARVLELLDGLRRSVDPARIDQRVAAQVDRAIDASLKEKIETIGLDLQGAIESLRADQEDTGRRIESVDRRTQLLVDRLVPVVRKAWLKIAEMQKGSEMGAPSSTAGLVEIRRELQAETHRVEAEMQRRVNDLRHHMETSLGHQSRVWLTLIQQLSQLTSAREDAVASEELDSIGDVWDESPRPASPTPERAGRPPSPPRDEGDARPPARLRPRAPPPS